jgi:hypothetical protein
MEKSNLFVIFLVKMLLPAYSFFAISSAHAEGGTVDTIVLKEQSSARDVEQYTRNLLKARHGKRALYYPNTGAPAARSAFPAVGTTPYSSAGTYISTPNGSIAATAHAANRLIKQKLIADNTESDQITTLNEAITQKLAAIPKEHIKILIETCVEFQKLKGRPKHTSRREIEADLPCPDFIKSATASLSSRKDLDQECLHLIRESLIDIPYFINIIESHGVDLNLGNPSAQSLIRLIETIDENFIWQNSIPAWTRVLQSNKGTATQGALLFLLKKSSTYARTQSYQAWSGSEIDGISRQKILLDSWRKSSKEEIYPRLYLAKTVAESGESDALIFLAQHASKTARSNDHEALRLQNTAHKFLMQLCEGAENDIKSTAQFIIKNHSRLNFDHSTKKYSQER